MVFSHESSSNLRPTEVEDRCGNRTRLRVTSVNSAASGRLSHAIHGNTLLIQRGDARSLGGLSAPFVSYSLAVSMGALIQAHSLGYQKKERPRRSDRKRNRQPTR